MNSNFHLSFQIPSSVEKFGYDRPIGFIGSCFSDEMYLKARFYGVNSFSNPFGTVFHPLAISRFISESFTSDHKERIIQRNDLFFSEDAGSMIFAFNSDELSGHLNAVRNQWLGDLQKAKFLFITFGTAWGYRSLSSRIIVANCHKLPGDHFVKELSMVEDIVAEWSHAITQLKSHNPELQIVFTVSPVRHTRDGFVENNRSKAILIEAVRQLNGKMETGYFPSYEIVIDELRDHRFFKEDRVHPSDEAVTYVWDRFVSAYCTEETRKIMLEVKRFRLSQEHRSLFEGSEEDKKHKASLSKIEQEFSVKYPEVRL